MSQVNVDSKHIEKLFFDLDDCITDVQKAIITINNGYRNLGAEWKDAKYKELGKIVDSCTKELVKVRDEFSKAFEKLRQLYEFILEYEGVELSAPRQNRLVTYISSRAANNGYYTNTGYLASLVVGTGAVLGTAGMDLYETANGNPQEPMDAEEVRNVATISNRISHWFDEQVALHNAMRTFDANYTPPSSDDSSNTLTVELDANNNIIG